MLRIDKKDFFTNRKLPNKKYSYFYNGENYEVSSDYVISEIGSSEEKCLFLLNELNATDEFLLDVYLQDLADENMQSYLRINLAKEIEKSLLDESKSYKFTLGTVEYLAYEDDEGKYHVNEIDEVGIYAGNARFSNFKDRLYGLLNMHTFDIQKTEEPSEG